MKIDWTLYFDKIFIYSCTSNFERRKELDAELKRIGLYNYEYYYGIKYDPLIDYNHFHKYANISHINATHGEYSIIKIAYELGYENILLMEDDICFLKDIDKIKEELDKFKDNKYKCNFYFFDYVYFNNMIANFSCVYLDRQAMEYMIYCIENFPLIIDNYCIDICLYPNYYSGISYGYCINDNIFNIQIDNDKIFPINILLAPKRICIQKDIENSYFCKQDNNKYMLTSVEEYNL